MIQVNDLKPGTSFAYENEIFSVLDICTIKQLCVA
ncbi:hypothetical protein SDC9_184210 [bioreactor metagenome]|uniref:Uncharacterized protein n=1 Tax=bioreactor metagenome TaxID=1076179 RepID=A0A645HD98_9ZZZZ